MRRFLLWLVTRLHNYLHDLEAAEQIATAEKRGVILSSPVTWPTWPVEQGTAVQPPIQTVTVPTEVADWTYPNDWAGS